MAIVEEIQTEEQMRALLERSQAAPVVLFKYSPTCGISHVAQEAWEEWSATAPEGVELARCDVLGARAAARGVTSWLGILHQSPQVLVLREGRCVAQTSHYSITERWLRDAAGRIAT